MWRQTLRESMGCRWRALSGYCKRGAASPVACSRELHCFRGRASTSPRLARRFRASAHALNVLRRLRLPDFVKSSAADDPLLPDPGPH